MTVQEAIEHADLVKPNAFDLQVKAAWLNTLEGRIAAEVFLMAATEFRLFHYRWPEDAGRQMLVQPPFDEIYPLWLQARIDQANGEYDKYVNTMQIYNEQYNGFVRWFAQVYEPAQGYIKAKSRC